METQISTNVSLAMSFLLLSCFILYAYSIYYRMRFLIERKKNIKAIQAHSSLIGLGIYLVGLVNQERGQLNDILKVLKEETKVGGDIKTDYSLGRWLASKNTPMSIEEKKKLNVDKFTQAIQHNEKEFRKHFNN